MSNYNPDDLFHPLEVMPARIKPPNRSAVAIEETIPTADRSAVR
jgi:hypothetical protein